MSCVSDPDDAPSLSWDAALGSVKDARDAQEIYQDGMGYSHPLYGRYSRFSAVGGHPIIRIYR